MAVNMVTGIIVLIVAAVLLISVGAYVIDQVNQNVPRPSDAELNATVDQVVSTGTTGFKLTGTLVLVIILGTIIGAIVAALKFGQ